MKSRVKIPQRSSLYMMTFLILTKMANFFFDMPYMGVD